MVKKPFVELTPKVEVAKIIEIRKKLIDLKYLNIRTKSNPILMMEMISLYLEQTPTLVTAMHQSMKNQDWNSLHAAVHKMIPSFSIMGMGVELENMAKKVQEFANNQQQMGDIHEMVAELGIVCEQSCKELEVELNRIKNEI